MKRLLGLLLVMGMVGCGIPVARLEDKGAKITKNEQGEVVEVHLNRKPIGWKRGQTPHPKISDAGLADIKGLTKLKVLNLGGTNITDAGLVHLVGLTKLETLNLGGTQISDAGLVHLKGLTNLEKLDLAGAKVTSAGVTEFRQALPDCKIIK